MKIVWLTLHWQHLWGFFTAVGSECLIRNYLFSAVPLRSSLMAMVCVFISSVFAFQYLGSLHGFLQPKKLETLFFSAILWLEA